MTKVPANAKQHTIYKLKDGTRVPGVTTILAIKAKPALYRWNNQMGLKGIDTSKYVDHLASIGTLAHQMVADHWRKVKTDTSEYTAEQIDKAENSLLSYLEWEKGHTIEPILIETPLVSEGGFGGTIDCYAKVDSIDTLLDLKTGKAIYDEYFYQLAAYDWLLRSRDYMSDTQMILRIGRDETEGFEVKKATEKIMKIGWSIFWHCLGIYQDEKKR